MGSLYTAAASYLDARAHGGRWLVRIEDIDKPRVVPGSAAIILRTLDRFGFEWHGEVLEQSASSERYITALDSLRCRGLTFECSCSRTQLAEHDRYPGHCRGRPRIAGAPTAVRLRVDPGHIQFTDRIQGTFRQDVAATVGDVILRRRDQVIAYLLAVVTDDAAQGITHVVRGADLLDSTPAQIYLHRQLGLSPPLYAHVPLLTESDGKKLAKSARSVRLDADQAARQLTEVFAMLNLAPPRELAASGIAGAWRWAIARWNVASVPKRLAHRLPA